MTFEYWSTFWQKAGIWACLAGTECSRTYSYPMNHLLKWNIYTLSLIPSISSSQWLFSVPEGRYRLCLLDPEDMKVKYTKITVVTCSPTKYSAHKHWRDMKEQDKVLSMMFWTLWFLRLRFTQNSNFKTIKNCL